MGREGPSVQMGSYIGDLVGKWGHILSGERKQLLAAGAGARTGGCLCRSFGSCYAGYRIDRTV